MTGQRAHATKTLYPIVDNRMRSLREKWYSDSHREISFKEFQADAAAWFGSSKLNDLAGLQSFPCVDVTMGCTHFIESFVLRHGWTGFQILEHEYAYYTLMGKHGVDIEDLEPGKPLIITMPHWRFCDVRPEWPELLRICEQRNIDIHIDMAWIITARDISIDLSHPCIKSVGMSLSKLNLQWSRIGLRFSRQKSMDSVTIFNDYYHDTNTVLSSIGSYWIRHFEPDYLWNNYGDRHRDLCRTLELNATKIVHVARDPTTDTALGIGRILGQSAPDSV